MNRIQSPISYFIFTAIFLFGCSNDPTGPYDPFLDDVISEYTYKRLNSFPHDVKAFTQGFVFYKDHFYEGTGLYGNSSIRKVEMKTGNVQHQTNLADDYFGEGITIFEEKIYQLTWLEKKGFVYQVDSL